MSIEHAVSWPPPYTVKSHPRARHVKLKASLQHGLELVVPRRFNHGEIPHILEKNKSWIEKQLLRIQTKMATGEADVLPQDIFLRAIDQRWRVDYLMSFGKLRMITRPQQELVLFGEIQNEILCKKMLMNWLKKQAEIHLLAQLKRVSEEILLPYHVAKVRRQTSLWGSCTAAKSISLNYKLLLLPPELARHIIIHELCHTVYLNHSEKFWRLVERFDPDYAAHRRAMRQAGQFIPLWVK